MHHYIYMKNIWILHVLIITAHDLNLYMHFTGSPNCPTIYTAINTTTFAVLIQKLQMTWLPEKYSVQVISSKQSIASIVHSSTLNGSTSFEVTSLQPDTVYNISVIPCNMAGCNESCDVHSVQTESEMSTEGEMSKQNAPLYALLNQSGHQSYAWWQQISNNGDIIFTQHTATVTI